MSHIIDVRWLLLLPLSSIMVFVSWVFWNLSKDIRAQKRRRIHGYRSSSVKIYWG
jgi:hypothetical protein